MLVVFMNTFRLCQQSVFSLTCSRSNTGCGTSSGSAFFGSTNEGAFCAELSSFTGPSETDWELESDGLSEKKRLNFWICYGNLYIKLIRKSIIGLQFQCH